MTETNKNDIVVQGCMGQVTGIGLALLIICILSIIFGCSSTKTVTETVIKHDTVKVVNLQHDSVRVIDSVMVDRWWQGDTCYVTKYRERISYRDRWHSDTVWKVRVDSIGRTAIKQNAEIGWWERFKLTLYGALLAALAILVIGVIIWCQRVYKNINE